MKKTLAILLTLALMTTLSLVSLAADLSESSSQDLNVNYTDYVPAATVYSLDVEWDDDLSFDYIAGAQGDWNVEEHTYDNAVEGKWEDDDVNVVITNHSNAAVEASVSIVNHSDKVTVAANQNSATLNSAVGTAKDAAPSFTFVLSVTGEPTEAITKAATATISFAEANEPVPVSPSNLQDRSYTLVKPTMTDSCEEAVVVYSIDFNSEGWAELGYNVASGIGTYICTEHCENDVHNHPADEGDFSYNGEQYCEAGGLGGGNNFEISENYIIVPTSWGETVTFELLSNDTLRVVVVSNSSDSEISVGDIFS